MSRLYKIGEFASMIGVSPETLRNWDKTGVLKPIRKIPRGSKGADRYYSEQQYQTFVNGNRKTIGYLYEDDIQTKDLICNYMTAKGYSFELVYDKNNSQENLINIVQQTINGEIERLVVYNKHYLGSEDIQRFIEAVFNTCNATLEIINNTEEN